MMVAGEDTPESYLKDGVDWILENMFFSNRIIDNWASLSEKTVSIVLR